MSASIPYPGLRELGMTYLHQDFELFGGTWEDAVQAFVEDASDATLSSTVSEIDQVLRIASNDGEIWNILKKTTGIQVDVRCDGWSLAPWLKAIQTKVRDGLESREKLYNDSSGNDGEENGTGPILTR